MQLRAGQALPTTRGRDGPQHRTVAATDLKIAACAGKEFAGEADNQFVPGDKPEMFVFDFRKPFEPRWIHSADRVGKLGRKHRDALTLRDHVSACGASPSKRPDRLVRGNGFGGAAGKTSS